jgi:hypothetical protein
MVPFLPKDELENIILACNAETVISLSQTNKTLHFLLNEAHMLKNLSIIHRLKETPETIQEFFILEKLTRKPIDECIYNIIKHNLADKFYDLIECTMKNQKCNWPIFLGAALEHGNNFLVFNLIELTRSTKRLTADEIWTVMMECYDPEGCLLLFSLRLLSFLKDVGTFYEGGKHAIFIYLLKIMDHKNVILELEKFVNNDTVKDFLGVSNQFNYIAEAACMENNKTVFLWTLNHGANNHIELANRIFEKRTWELMYLLIEHQKNNIDKNFVEYSIELIQLKARARGKSYYGLEKELQLLEYLIKLNDDAL